MFISHVAGRVAKVRSVTSSEHHGDTVKFTMFARPIGWLDDTPILCILSGKDASALKDTISDDCFVSVMGGVVAMAHPDGTPYLSMKVKKINLQGFAVEGEMLNS